MSEVKVEVPEGYKAVWDEDKTTVKVVKDEGGYWEPKDDDDYWFVNSYGLVGSSIWVNASLDMKQVKFHNIFQSEAQAKKAAELMRRNNAIVRACLLVDPYFEPDWGNRSQNKYTVGYQNDEREWQVDTYGPHRIYNPYVAYVSTSKKAEEVCDLLTKWGIK